MTQDDTRARRRIARVIRSLSHSQPFFGHTAMMVAINGAVTDSTRETIACDGERFYYNPQWVLKTPAEDLKAATARLVLACYLKHHTRRGEREYETWQQASELATRPILRSEGLTNESGGYEAPVEVIYNKIAREKGQKGANGQDGQNNAPSAASAPGESGGGNEGKPSSHDPQGKGEIMDSPAQSQKDKQEAEREWDKRASQAHSQARAWGSGTGRVAELLEDARNPKVSWKEQFRRFMTASARRDYTWSRPNRRHIAAGLYLPAMHSEALGRVVFAVDNSGSMGRDELQQIWSELRSAVEETQPESLEVLVCDTEVNKAAEFTPASMPTELDIRGGGGTAFAPIFHEVAKSRQQPVCLVYFTDLYCNDWKMPNFPFPSYPVIWCVYGGADEMWTPSFGERLDVPAVERL